MLEPYMKISQLFSWVKYISVCYFCSFLIQIAQIIFKIKKKVEN